MFAVAWEQEEVGEGDCCECDYAGDCTPAARERGLIEVGDDQVAGRGGSREQAIPFGVAAGGPPGGAGSEGS